MVETTNTQVVWFKRDLRVRDHEPLCEAAKRGPVLGLYVYEPELLESPEWDSSHSVFIDECLAELEAALRVRGGRLIYAVGAMPDVLEDLHRAVGIAHLWSHEETGNHLTYMRDLRVIDWCAHRGVPWTECFQTGVVRRLKSRDGWARRWQQRMSRAVLPAPERIISPALSLPDRLAGPRRSLLSLGQPVSTKDEVQRGGESVARETLESFLEVRGVNYRADMSSPVEGWDGCSRLSPYLAWGAISVKSVFHATEARAHRVRLLRTSGRDIDPRWAGSLESFGGRLRWHCHFMQKLESEPRVEFQNVNRAYDGMRENEFDDARFAAWREGRTGFPMIDACMRALHRSGWINFRMRAMLMSFASYQLWLHWRPTSVYLARHFLDFEPGIHFTQAQMQSGVTGINTIRIYSPNKQQVDQDPDGVFVRKYLPELRGVPDKYLVEPFLMPKSIQRASGCQLDVDYPRPIVDPARAFKHARARIDRWKRRGAARQEAKRVYKKHGSRRSPGSRPWNKRPGGPRPPRRPRQPELPFDR